MANDLNNADKLIERILADAHEEAEHTAQEAQESIQQVKELAGHDVWEILSEAQIRSKRLRDDILERSRTNAELDSRKYMLAAKRGVVEHVFSTAYEQMCALSGAERDALLTTCILAEADGGEAIIPSLADEAALSRLLDGINATLASNGKSALTLLSASGTFDAGFILRSRDYEKNCSFAAMLREMREHEESSVANILFG
ncbi:MAG: V-type ATP synthase subunit E family protein [Clostridia bacterium]